MIQYLCMFTLWSYKSTEYILCIYKNILKPFAHPYKETKKRNQSVRTNCRQMLFFSFFPFLLTGNLHIRIGDRESLLNLAWKDMFLLIGKNCSCCTGLFQGLHYKYFNRRS